MLSLNFSILFNAIIIEADCNGLYQNNGSGVRI